MLKEKLKQYYESLYKDFRVTKEGKVIHTNNFKGIWNEINLEIWKVKKEKKKNWVVFRLFLDYHILTLLEPYLLSLTKSLSKIFGEKITNKFLSLVLKKNKENLLFNIYIMFFLVFFFSFFFWVFIVYLVFCNIFLKNFFIEDKKKIENDINFLTELIKKKQQNKVNSIEKTEIFFGEKFPELIPGEKFLVKFSEAQMVYFIEQINKEIAPKITNVNPEKNLTNKNFSILLKNSYFGNIIYRKWILNMRKNYNFFAYKFLGKSIEKEKEFLKNLVKIFHKGDPVFFDNLIFKFFNNDLSINNSDLTKKSFADFFYFLIFNCKWIYYSNNYIYIIFENNYAYFSRDFLVEKFGKSLILGSKENPYLNFRGFPLKFTDKNLVKTNWNFIRKFRNKYFDKLEHINLIKKKKRRKRNFFRGYFKYHLRFQKKMYDFRVWKYAHRNKLYKNLKYKNLFTQSDSKDFRLLFIKNLKKKDKWKPRKLIRRFNNWSRILKMFRLRFLLKFYRRNFRIFSRKFSSKNKIDKFEIKNKTIRLKKVRSFRKKFRDNLGYLKWFKKRRKKYMKRWRWLIHKKLFKPRKKRWVLKKKLPSLEKRYMKNLKKMRKKNNLKAVSFFVKKPKKKAYLNLLYKKKYFGKLLAKKGYFMPKKFYKKQKIIRTVKTFCKKTWDYYHWNIYGLRQYWLNYCKKIQDELKEKNLIKWRHQYKAAIKAWLWTKGPKKNPSESITKKLSRTSRNLRLYKSAWLYKKNSIDIYNRRLKKSRKKLKIQRLFKRSFFRKLNNELNPNYVQMPTGTVGFIGPFIRRYTPYIFYNKDRESKSNLKVSIMEKNFKQFAGLTLLYSKLKEKKIFDQKKNILELGLSINHLEQGPISKIVALKILKNHAKYNLDLNVKNKAPFWITNLEKKEDFFLLKPYYSLYDKRNIKRKYMHSTAMLYRTRIFRGWFKQGLFMHKRKKKGGLWKHKIFNKNYLRNPLSQFSQLENWKNRLRFKWNIFKGKTLEVYFPKKKNLENFIIYRKEVIKDKKNLKVSNLNLRELFLKMDSFMEEKFLDWKFNKTDPYKSRLFKNILKNKRNLFHKALLGRKKKKRRFGFRIKIKKNLLDFRKRYRFWRKLKVRKKILKRWSVKYKKYKNAKKFKKFKKYIRYEHLTKIKYLKSKKKIENKKFFTFQKKIYKGFPPKSILEKKSSKKKRMAITSVRKYKKWRRKLIPFKTKNMNMYRSDLFKSNTLIAKAKRQPKKQFISINPLIISNKNYGMSLKLRKGFHLIKNLNTVNLDFKQSVTKPLETLNKKKYDPRIKHILGLPLDIKQIFFKKVNDDRVFLRVFNDLKLRSLSYQKINPLELFDDDPFVCNSNARLRAWFLLNKSWHEETFKEQTVNNFFWENSFKEIYRENIFFVNFMKKKVVVPEKFLLQKLNLDLEFNLEKQKELEKKKIKFQKSLNKVIWSNFWEKNYLKDVYWINKFFREKGLPKDIKINPEYYTNILFYKTLNKAN